MKHPLKMLLEDIHAPDTDTLISTLHHIVGKYTTVEVQPLLKKYTDLYVLAGVLPSDNLLPYPRNTRDGDVYKKKYVVFDFDVRKEKDISDAEIQEEAQQYTHLIADDPFLAGWKYLSYSGNGFHLWYVSEEAFDISPHMWPIGYKDVIERFQTIESYQPDPACGNAARIIRLPYSINTKRGERKQTSIISINENWNSRMVEYIATYQKKIEGTPVPQMLEKIKREPIPPILASLGYQIDAKHRVILSGKPSSIVYHPEKNFLNRFSKKPGSGDVVSFLKGVEGLTFLEAIQKIASTYFHEDVAPTERECVTHAHEVKKREAKSYAGSTYTPIEWNTPLMNAQFPPIKRYCYVVMAGETKSGKSTVAFDLAVKNAEKGQVVLYITLEMTALQLIENIARSNAGISPLEEHRKLKVGHYQPKQERIFAETKARIQNIPTLHILGRTIGATENIEHIIDTILSYDHVDLVVIDNLDKVENMEGQTDFDKQKDVSNQLLHFTNDYHIPVILVHHLRKSSDEKRAMFRNVDALSGTGKISHDANIVCMVSREKDETGMYTSNATFIRIAETREFDPAIRKVYFGDGTFYDENPVRMTNFDFAVIPSS